MSVFRTTSSRPARTRALASPVLVFVLAVSVSAGMGAAVGRYGAPVALGVIVALGGAVTLVAFARNPSGALLVLWVYEVIRLALASLLGYETSRGQLVQQADNYVIVALFIAAMVRALSADFKLKQWRYTAFGFLVAVIGTVSSVVNHVQFGVAALGLWQGLRIWLLLAIALVIPWEQRASRQIYQVFTWVGSIVAFFGLVDLVAKSSFRHFLHTDMVSLSLGDYRASSAVESIFTTPGKFSLCMSLLFGLTLSSYATRRHARDACLSIGFAIGAVLSLRLQAVLSLAAVVILVSLFGTRLRGMTSLRILMVSLLVGVAAYTIAGEAVQHQVQTYSSTSTTARSRLYTTGERIAQDYFPLGSGFGTFGSSPSRKHYSQLYFEYGLGEVYGLSPQYRQFIDDTSWPSVMAETGYLGFACYVVGLLLLGLSLARGVARVREEDSYLPMAALCGLVVIVLQSVANPTLFDGFAAVTLGLLVGPALASAQRSSPRTLVKELPSR
jgi:hypothetical protein